MSFNIKSQLDTLIKSDEFLDKLDSAIFRLINSGDIDYPLGYNPNFSVRVSRSDEDILIKVNFVITQEKQYSVSEVYELGCEIASRLVDDFIFSMVFDVLDEDFDVVDGDIVNVEHDVDFLEEITINGELIEVDEDDDDD